jgi:hypothetical protein
VNSGINVVNECIIRSQNPFASNYFKTCNKML